MPNRSKSSIPRFSLTDPAMYRIRKASFLSYHLKFLLPLLILLTSNVSPIQAQGAYFWSEQEKIPNYFPIAQQPPYLIADQYQIVHAFNSQPIDLNDDNSPKAIFYRQWSVSGEWTFPNDILVDEAGGNVEILDVTSNSSGNVYLIYQKNFGDVYFTHAYLPEAGKSTAWAQSILIARQSTSFSTGFEGIAAISVDDDGAVVVIYSGSESGKGLYSTYSLDSGENWTKPYPVFLTGDESMVVTDPELFFGESGKIHGVWTTFKSDGFGGPGYYVNFDLGTRTWNEPTELDVPGIRTPSVIEFKSDVIVSYYHFSTNGNWWRRSFDGGSTWSTPIQLSPHHIGTNGRVSFVVDSSNTLHAFFGERINDLNHGMWHSIWMDGVWTPPEAIVRGPQIRDVDGGNGFDPGAARAIISNGNLVLVTWITDGFAGVNGAWFSYKLLNIPALPILEDLDPPNNTNPSLSITSTPGEPIVNEPTNTIVPLIDGIDQQPSALLVNPQIPIYSGIVLALVVIVGVFISMVITKSRKS